VQVQTIHDQIVTTAERTKEGTKASALYLMVLK
jgi:hypothetical protein